MCHKTVTYTHCLICKKLVSAADATIKCSAAKVFFFCPRYGVLGCRKTGTTVWVRCSACKPARSLTAPPSIKPAKAETPGQLPRLT